MQTLQEPAVSLESVKIRGLHLTSIDLDVTLAIKNPNPITAFLREFPFTVFFRTKAGKKEIATGNTGKFEIPADQSITVTVPVTSFDLPLLEAIADIVERGDLQLGIEGDAVIDHIMGWTLHLVETVDVTRDELAEAIEGKLGEKKRT